ncbi:MAG: DUF1080 domain-containing protein [Saprospiraceae bacterium]
MLRILIFISLFSYATALIGQGDTEHWKPLFPDSSLNGYQLLNGKARMYLEKNPEASNSFDQFDLIGISTAGTPNTFLCSETQFGDFILEFSVLVDSSLNSGVQIRSASKPDYQQGRVHGYQVEIDPSTRAWSGGIYEEGRRGWLYPLTRSPLSRSAFVNGRWNHYHIEARGNELKTWVNGIQCAWLYDSLDARGFIAFQVHSIGQAELAGKSIRWRGLRIRTEALDEASWHNQQHVTPTNLTPGFLSQHEAAEGWEALPNPIETFEKYSLPSGAYELSFHFKMHSDSLTVIDASLPALSGDNCTSLSLRLRQQNGIFASRFVVQTKTGLNTQEPKTPVYYGNEHWNHGRLVVDHGHIEWWLNGQLLAQHLYSTEWNERSTPCNYLRINTMYGRKVELAGLKLRKPQGR